MDAAREAATEGSLDARLAELQRHGWQAFERRVVTLKRADRRSAVLSFYGASLAEVVPRAENVTKEETNG